MTLTVKGQREKKVWLSLKSDGSQPLPPREAALSHHLGIGLHRMDSIPPVRFSAPLQKYSNELRQLLRLAGGPALSYSGLRCLLPSQLMSPTLFSHLPLTPITL